MRTYRIVCALALLTLGAHAPAAAQRFRAVSPPRARHVAQLRTPTAQCPALPQPNSVRSSGGVLTASLSMQPATFRIGDSTYTRNEYNGKYLADVLRMDRNQQLSILVSNNMRRLPGDTVSYQWTNQHYHGMIVTPVPNPGDNVTNVMIRPGQSNQNNFFVPPPQSEGMMWYHPHPHGLTQPQVTGGLAGALIVGDLLASYPAYAGATERVMYIKSVNGGTTLDVNGNPCSLMSIGPGERQLWRIGNMTGGTWVNLKLGERGSNYKFILLAMDGNHFARPLPVDSLFIAPGSRAEAIVIGGTGSWNARFYSDSIATAYDRATGKLKPRSPVVDLGYLVTTGLMSAVRPEALDPSRLPIDRVLQDSIRKLETDTDVDTFTVHYQLVGTGLGLNGKQYSPTRLDRAVAVGRTQEWTLINDTWFLHTFHIHQVDFVVTSVNGHPATPDSVHLDNVHLGIHQLPNGRWAPDTVVIRFRFLPIAAGPFVYHCHDLFHEDAGMMANVCVYDPARGQTPGTCTQWFPGGPSTGAHGAHGMAGMSMPHPGTPPPAPPLHPADHPVAAQRAATL
ncbi:MAG TPA: multicopper oxidase family protein, partial [Longimicrobiaceae bacterium]|nr:multicopper oxidase family protein [Longimicrobiaceae bacterium]